MGWGQGQGTTDEMNYALQRPTTFARVSNTNVRMREVSGVYLSLGMTNHQAGGPPAKLSSG